MIYEDSRAARGRFALHDLFLSMVADRTSIGVHDLRSRAKALPLRGVQNVLKSIRQPDRLDRHAPHGAHILIVVDGDRIRPHLRLPPDAPVDVVGNAIRERCEQRDQRRRLWVAVLDENVESLIQVIGDCDESHAIPTDLVQAALRKDINARDRALEKAAYLPDGRDLRDCIHREMPSVGPAIRFLIEHVAA